MVLGGGRVIHKMGLQKQYFDAVKNKIKKVEVRLNDEKRQTIKIGDILLFLEEPNRILENGIYVVVKDLQYYSDFNELLDNVSMNVLGTNQNRISYLEDLNHYYSLEKQKKYGVVAIEIEDIIKKEKSCGIVVFRKNNSHFEVLLVHHNKGHWGFPKGHIEIGETEEETALRETFEETNIEATIIEGFRKVITYSPKEKTVKDVVFFVGVCENYEVLPQISEVNQVSWIEVNKAFSLITHDDERSVLQDIINYYQKKEKE